MNFFIKKKQKSQYLPFVENESKQDILTPVYYDCHLLQMTVLH